MAVRNETLAFARQIPYMLERGVAQTIECPIRYGSTGALQVPAEGTITITRPDGTDLVTDGVVVIPASTAQYTLTPSASEALGEGWTLYWTLTIDGQPYTWRQSGYLCEYVPPNVISADDLYKRIPELAGRIPRRQGPSGTNEGWQPQIDEVYFEFIQKLLDDARKPWLIREVTGYREWMLTHTLERCVKSKSYGPESSWAQKAKELYWDTQRAEGKLRFQYSDEPANRRKAGGGPTRTAPSGRPRW